MRDLGYVEGQSFILGSARGKHVSTARIRSPLKREQVPSDPHDPDRDVHAPRPVARRSRHEPGPPRREHYRAHPRRWGAGWPASSSSCWRRQCRRSPALPYFWA